MHPFSSAYPLQWDEGKGQDTILNTAVNYRDNTLRRKKPFMPIKPMDVFGMECGRKLEYPENTGGHDETPHRKAPDWIQVQDL